jgi:hypothetical protein
MAQHERNKDRQTGEQSKTDRSKDQLKKSDDRNQQNPGMGQRQNISENPERAGKDSDRNRNSDNSDRDSMDEERGVI